MNIITERQGPLGGNCYMLSSQTGAIIIDPSAVTETLENFIRENAGKQMLILATHRHFDHVSAVAATRTLSGAAVAIHPDDACGLESSVDSMGIDFGIYHEPVTPDILLSDGQVLTVGDITVRVIHTPGHTIGSCSFLIENALFSGDTLFCQSVGRTDFPTGDTGALMQSLGRLFALDCDYTVYPGHEQPTTLYYEKSYNPFYYQD